MQNACTYSHEHFATKIDKKQNVKSISVNVMFDFLITIYVCIIESDVCFKIIMKYNLACSKHYSINIFIGSLKLSLGWVKNTGSVQKHAIYYACKHFSLL